VQPRALGRKVSDEFTVPLCRTHHREIHRCGDEQVWWRKAGIDPLAAAHALWLQTRPLPRAKRAAGHAEAAAKSYPVNSHGKPRSPEQGRQHPKTKPNVTTHDLA
jgi:hypothetical protein